MWFSNFIASFRKSPEAEPAHVKAQFDKLAAAPAKKRADLARTMRPEEITQMLQHARQHVEQQTEAATEEAHRVSKAMRKEAKAVKRKAELAATGAFRSPAK